MINAKWFVGIFLLFTVTVFLDLHFRLILIIGVLSIFYTIFKKSEKLNNLELETELINRKALFVSGLEQNVALTVMELNAIHTTTSEKERESQLYIANLNAETKQKSIEKQEQLQILEHQKEYKLLDERESQQNLKLSEKCQQLENETKERCLKNVEQVKANCVKKLAEMNAKRQLHKNADSERVKNATQKSANDFRHAAQNL